MATAKKSRPAPKKPRSSPSLPPPPDWAAMITAARASAFGDLHPERAFAHFRPLAETVSTEGLTPFTGQPLVMRANILRALDAIEPHLPAAVAQLREPRLVDVFELPALVMGLEYATGRVPAAKLSPGEIDRMLADGTPWRELTLKYLEVVASPLLGLVPQARVRAIREGTGKLDKAQDFVAIAGVFNEFGPALAHKHPFPAEKLDLLGSLGATLVQHVRPGNAPTAAMKRSPESVLRDRFAALVTARYDHLQVLAAVAVGRREADALLPALRAVSVTSASGDTTDTTEADAPKPA